MRRNIKIFLGLIFTILTLSSGCLELREAYIPSNILTNGWNENIGDREQGSNYFGLEKWFSETYENKDASLTVTTIKTLIMMDMKKLSKKVDEDILSSCGERRITVDMNSRIQGERIIKEGHKTTFIIYNGSKEDRLYRIIGEVWSCSKSGTSIICLGIIDMSSIYGELNWEKIVGDPYGNIDDIKRDDGLIYNVNCH